VDKYFNARYEMATLYQEKIGNTLDYIGIGNNFLKKASVAQQLRKRIDKRKTMILKCFCPARELSLDLRYSL
jgi:hypothetical protein